MRPRVGFLLCASSFGLGLGLGACGSDPSDGPGRDGGGTVTTASAADVRVRPELRFVAVEEVLAPDACVGEPGLVRSVDGEVCYRLAADGFGVSRYGVAEANGGSTPDGASIEVTLTAKDLERFNGLASTCFGRAGACATGQVAVVFGGAVQTAPMVQEPSFSGSIMITGTRTSITDLFRAMNGR